MRTSKPGVPPALLRSRCCLSTDIRVAALPPCCGFRTSIDGVGQRNAANTLGLGVGLGLRGVASGEIVLTTTEWLPNRWVNRTRKPSD
jgi:hypothetical protein